MAVHCDIAIVDHQSEQVLKVIRLERHNSEVRPERRKQLWRPAVHKQQHEEPLHRRPDDHEHAQVLDVGKDHQTERHEAESEQHVKRDPEADSDVVASGVFGQLDRVVVFDEFEQLRVHHFVVEVNAQLAAFAAEQHFVCIDLDNNDVARSEPDARTERYRRTALRGIGERQRDFVWWEVAAMCNYSVVDKKSDEAVWPEIDRLDGGSIMKSVPTSVRICLCTISSKPPTFNCTIAITSITID